MKIAKPNRDKKRNARTNKFWCDICDGAKVAEGVNCKACGNKNGTKRNKKPYPPIED